MKADALDGMRWYEARSPAAKPTIYQQGTYAPDDPVTDPLYRRLGSAAMDKTGKLAA